MSEKGPKWENKVLKSWNSFKSTEGVLKSRWELVQSVSADGKQKTKAAVQKTSFYKDEDGKLTRGFAQALNLYDLRYVVENAPRFESLIKSVPGGGKAENKSVPTSVGASAQESEHVEESHGEEFI